MYEYEYIYNPHAKEDGLLNTFTSCMESDFAQKWSFLTGLGRLARYAKYGCYKALAFYA